MNNMVKMNLVVLVLASVLGSGVCWGCIQCTNLNSHASSKLPKLEENITPEQLKSLKEKAAAGDRKSMQILGYRYVAGIGIPRDEKKALEIIEQWAESGDIAGMQSLAQCYESGGESFESNIDAAVKWYMRAANKGSFQSAIKAYYICNNGHNGSPMNIEKAEESIEVAEHIVNSEERCEYLLTLANIFAQNDRLQNNKTKALEYYSITAEKGNLVAMLNLSKAYYEGSFVTQNTETGRMWINRAIYTHRSQQ